MVQKQQPTNKPKTKPKKTSRGQQKIEIKRIEKNSSRQVTLCKRRKGLFSKAAELCILTGAKIGIITQAENGKINTFSHPNLDCVVHDYVSDPNSEPASFPPIQIDAELVDEDKKLSSELEAEKKKLKANVGNNFWWNEPMDNLGLEELEQCLDSLIALRNNVIALSSEEVVAEDKAVFNDQYQHQSQFMGVEMEQTPKADELDSKDYFDLEKSLVADELLKESQTVASEFNDFSSSLDYTSLFCFP